MESNIYYQLARTECALDRCKAKLFKKNLAMLGLLSVTYILGKAFVQECKKCVDAKKERDELAEKHDKVLYELNQMKQKEENKTVHCEGHVSLSED